MESNVDRSLPNQDVRLNHLISEGLVASSKESPKTYLGHKKVSGGQVKKNITDHMNGNDYSLDGSFDVEELCNETLSRSDRDHEVIKNKQSSFNPNEPIGNENSSSSFNHEKINESCDQNLNNRPEDCVSSARENKNSLSECILASENKDDSPVQPEECRDGNSDPRQFAMNVNNTSVLNLSEDDTVFSNNDPREINPGCGRDVENEKSLDNSQCSFVTDGGNDSTCNENSNNSGVSPVDVSDNSQFRFVTISSNKSKLTFSDNNKVTSLCNDESSQQSQLHLKNTQVKKLVLEIDKSNEERNVNGNQNPIDGEMDKSNDKETEKVLKPADPNLKIQLVTSLDVFVDEDANNGSPAPTTPPANPLETDCEDTNDNDENSVDGGSRTNHRTSNTNVNESLIDVNDSSDNEADGDEITIGSENKRIQKDSNFDALKNMKDAGDQEEVITGDKTISQEFVTKNLELLGDESPLNDHGYSKQGAPPFEGNESSAGKSKTLKVIYPRRKVVDVSQLDVRIMTVPVLKNCLHCAKLAKCCILIDIGGCECHLCSEECLEKHKTLQSNTLRRTSLQPEIILEKESSETRLCVQCNADVGIQPEEKILSWETMEFCNEDCLGKYQARMWTCCTACSKEVPTASMGKYCVRFGHEIKQFCCSSCLEDFKKGIKACSYCQKDLTVGDEGFLAPIADKNQFRDFCSQNCLDEYDCMARNLPAGGLKVEACSVCVKKQLVQVQVITSSNIVNLCSEVCFNAFKFVNRFIYPTPCYMCKKYFESNSPNKVTVFYENELLSFCSKTCMNINILTKRRIVPCTWCKVKKYNFDMIRRKANNIVTNWCSLNCMALYQVCNKSNCAQCYKYGFPSLHLTMSDASIRNFCSLECVNKFQANIKKQPGNIVFPTGGPKRVVRTKAPLTAISEKRTSFPEIAPKDKPGSMVKAITVTHNAASPVGATIMQNAIDEPPCASPVTPSVPAAAKPNTLSLHAINPDVKNAKIQVYCHKVDKGISAKPYKSTRSIQTEETTEKGPMLIPVPVPIYVPVPMAMYSLPVPTPFPFPVPIPVPIIIPTTKGTAEEIMEDIKKIQEKMPGNPFEAELIMMAEMAEGQKKSSGDPVVGEETRLSGQKRNIDDLELDDAPPEKKRREDTKTNVLDNTVHYLATSRLSMSLKETLGVCAWKHYASQNGERLDLLEMRPGELAQALKRFILNARIPGEGEYTPDQKYYLMLGIQYYLEESGRIENIFSDKLFEPFIDALNEEALKFQKTFANSDHVITRVEEEHLWESKQLGAHTPSTLLATLIYFNTKYFNLTTVEEHMQLSFSQIMKHWKRNPNAAQPSSNNTKPSNGSRNIILRFFPPQSSLDAPNSKKKKVYEQEPNEADLYRCPVQLYEFYLSKCPESMKSRNDMFYLNPERSCVSDSPIWYSTLPLDPEVIDRALNRFKMVKEINLSLFSDV